MYSTHSIASLYNAILSCACADLAYYNKLINQNKSVVFSRITKEEVNSIEERDLIIDWVYSEIDSQTDRVCFNDISIFFCIKKAKLVELFFEKEKEFAKLSEKAGRLYFNVLNPSLISEFF